jgi:hypothetical protein
MILQDVSHRREAERRAQEHQLSLQHLATHDALTGPPQSHLSQRRTATTHRRSGAARRFAVHPLYRLRQLQEHQRFTRPFDRRRLPAQRRTAPA